MNQPMFLSPLYNAISNELRHPVFALSSTSASVPFLSKGSKDYSSASSIIPNLKKEECILEFKKGNFGRKRKRSVSEQPYVFEDKVSSFTSSFSSDNSKKLRPQTKKKSWEDRYEELKAFFLLHGHCNVTQHDKSLRSLGNWVSKQRQRKKKGYKTKYSKLADWQVAKLDEIGFEWDRSNWSEKRKMRKVNSSSSLSSIRSSSLSSISYSNSLSSFSSFCENESTASSSSSSSPESSFEPTSRTPPINHSSIQKTKVNFLLNDCNESPDCPQPSQSDQPKQLSLLVRKSSEGTYIFKFNASVRSVDELVKKICSTFGVSSSSPIFLVHSSEPMNLVPLPSSLESILPNSLILISESQT